MSRQTGEWKNILDRTTIVPQSFYIRTEESNYYPQGIIKMYRKTRTSSKPPDSEFTYQAVRIRNPEELAQVKIALDWLADTLNWQELPEVLEEFKEQLEKEKEGISPTTLKLIRMYPKAAEEVLKGFDKVFRGHIEIEDFPIVEKVVKTAITLLSNQTRHMIETKMELLEKLGREKTTEGIKRLTKLLEQHDLPQLTSVASIIMDRLQRIKYLKATIQNEKAYELKGKDSVHNQLANSLWIIDDSYWLLYSNKTLATFLKKKIKKASKFEKERPDLICANDRNRLVIVELKRPSHEIRQEDINQLHNYIITADQFRASAFREKKRVLNWQRNFTT